MIVMRCIWKTPVVVVALLVGCFGANQAGWSGGELVVNAPLMGVVEELITGVIAFVSMIMAVAVALLVRKIAKPALWVMVPVLLYCALVPGVWYGVESDFDWTRGQAIRHGFANAYVLEHMSARGRFLTCEDERIELTDDAKAACALARNAAPGERIPGSEHRCGPLGMSSCFDTAREK
jgi:hypothetical protein